MCSKEMCLNLLGWLHVHSAAASVPPGYCSSSNVLLLSVSLAVSSQELDLWFLTWNFFTRLIQVIVRHHITFPARDAGRTHVAVLLEAVLWVNSLHTPRWGFSELANFLLSYCCTISLLLQMCLWPSTNYTMEYWSVWQTMNKLRQCLSPSCMFVQNPTKLF